MVDFMEEVRSEFDNVTGRLHDLGLSLDILRESLAYGVGFAFDCTALDPPFLPGILIYGKVTRSLRERLIISGWTSDNTQNYATTINPARDLAIAVSSGDFNTGSIHRSPTTRNEKGPVTRQAVKINQLTLADIKGSTFPRPFDASTMRTWLLLHYVDEDAEEVRIELSLPAEITEAGLVTGWSERIILPPLKFTGVAPHIDQPSNDGSDDIDIEVERI